MTELAESQTLPATMRGVELRSFERNARERGRVGKTCPPPR